MTKVVALGDKHKSVPSLLSQAMADETIKNVVIVTFHENGDCETAQFQRTRQQIAYASGGTAPMNADKQNEITSASKWNKKGKIEYERSSKGVP